MQAQPVLEVISNRLTYRNFGLERPDNFKLGLAVEGGGMRGILTMAMLMALKDLKMLDAFDVFVGTSSGSLNLAYVLAGQGAMGLSVYFDDMTKAENLNLRRVRSKQRPILDMRSIYTNAMAKKLLNEKVLETYAQNFYAAVSNVSSNSGELVSLSSAGHRFYEYLIAGATVPFVAGKPWKINNSDYYDGGLFYIDPLHAAQELGCTHVLVLNSTYLGYELKPSGRVLEHILRRLDDDYHDAGTHYTQSLEQWVRVQNSLPWGATDLNHVQLYRHAVHRESRIGRVTTDPAKLLNGVKAGYQSILDLFAPDEHAGIIPSIM